MQFKKFVRRYTVNKMLFEEVESFICKMFHHFLFEEKVIYGKILNLKLFA